MPRSFALLLLLFVPGGFLQARIDLLLVPPAGAVTAGPGTELTLYLNNPTELAETMHLPREWFASYASERGQGRVRLVATSPAESECAVPPMSRRTVVLQLIDTIPGAGGFVSLRLTDPATNAIMFEVLPAEPVAARSSTSPARRPPLVPGRHLDLTSDLEAMRRHISGYDPIYFAVGWRERFNARFQFSFKYRVFESGPPAESWARQAARDFYFAYTQTTIWDLETFSKPFYDSSYKPTAFLLRTLVLDPERTWRLTLQAGAQHESNGKGGGATPVYPDSGLLSPTNAQRHASDTRSLNTLYLAPKLRWTGDNDFFVEARAHASIYFQNDENPDIHRYRGYVDLLLRAGYDRGIQASLQARGKVDGHGSIELNFTWPAIQTPLLKLIIPRTFGGYAQVQYFNGYGESLLDYDVRRKDQLRFGLMITR